MFIPKNDGRQRPFGIAALEDKIVRQATVTILNQIKFALKRKTIAKRMRAKLKETKQELRRRMHDPVEQTGKWLQSVIQGYFNYHVSRTMARKDVNPVAWNMVSTLRK